MKRRDEAGSCALRALAIVPARLASTRLPRKMLLRETGSYLFEHTVAACRAAEVFEQVVLATDADEVVSAAHEVGVEVVMTSERARSGTDRVQEAHTLLRQDGRGPWDVIVNVQGDEPELPPDAMAQLVALFEDPAVEVGTLCAPLGEPREARDPSVVKVVRDRRGDALYFSRAAIPSCEHPSRPMRPGAPGLAAAQRHVGVYAFRPDALTRFCGLPSGDLEATENLEQLRWLEAGQRIRVGQIDHAPAGIDTPLHYAAFLARTRTASPLESPKAR